MTIPFPVLAIPLVGQLLVALVMLAIPHITPRNLLFGVPVPEGFRSTGPGRRALRSYRLLIAIPGALSLLAILFFPKPRLLTPAALALTAVGMAAFVAENRKLKPFAVQPARVRETTLGPPESLPWFTWLGILPLLFLAGEAMFIHAHWDRIPLRYPVHFGIDGTPNRWANRTPHSGYGMLIFGGELAVFMFALALAGWYGTRQSEPMRKPTVAVLLTAELVVALVCGSIPLRLVGGIAIPTLAMTLGPLLLLIPATLYGYRESNKPRDPIDPTPNECWKGGVIYYNPNDAALFVQRRDGIGLTPNFANRWSWMIFGGLLLALASMPPLLLFGF